MTKLDHLLGVGVFSALVATSSMVAVSYPAVAGEIATRCTEYGCVHIECNRTGDQCHRFYDGDRSREEYHHHYLRHYEQSWDDRSYDVRPAFYGDDEAYSRWHYDCDHDADDCYMRHEGYREW
ncbi:MAG: hypothetical protein KGJ78_00365 [Alphaproteobacteria bacterium]|nr:hypothetical protein [Alphaproteobacteria bacterium]